MLERILAIDRDLFLWLNSLHQPWLDDVMVYITARATWYPFYLLIIAYIIYYEGWKRGIKLIMLIIVGVGLADFVSSGIMKPYFERPRPCHEMSMSNLIFSPVGCGGQFGFASSHAANSFALATMLNLLFSRQWGGKVRLMFIWAFLVSFSRVYVGVHYPLDIIVGAIVGATLAYLTFHFSEKLRSKTISFS